MHISDWSAYVCSSDLSLVLHQLSMLHHEHMGWNCVIGSAAKCTRPRLLRRCSGSSGAHDMKLTTVGGSSTNAAATERSACASGGSPVEPRDRKSVVSGKRVSSV